MSDKTWDRGCGVPCRGVASLIYWGASQLREEGGSILGSPILGIMISYQLLRRVAPVWRFSTGMGPGRAGSQDMEIEVRAWLRVQALGP